tara:strand:+ start:105073 stop:105309 length:237 start_codon:yes stop_codon:yes gene_type:complete
MTIVSISSTLSIIRLHLFENTLIRRKTGNNKRLIIKPHQKSFMNFNMRFVSVDFDTINSNKLINQKAQINDIAKYAYL